MHEYHIVESIVKQLIEKAQGYNAKSVSKVTLALGDLTGLSQESILLYFKTIAENTMLKNAEVIIKTKNGKEFYIENMEVEE